MLILLSPSKTLASMVQLPSGIEFSEPEFLSQSKKLIALLQKHTQADLEKLMEISPKLASLNHQRYQDFPAHFHPKTCPPCILSFQGDVYDGLKAAEFTHDDLNYSHQHLRILSGLYGLLRPLDMMHPYRLEMGILLKNVKGKDLYAFWGDTITKAINQAAKSCHAKTVINLASQEYFKAVKPNLLELPLITPVFKERKGNELKVIGLFAKRARGMMAHYLLKNRHESPDAIRHFNENGYQWDEPLSNANEWVFVR